MTREKTGRGKHETSFDGQIGHGRKGGQNTREDTALKKGYDPRYNGPNKNRSCTDVICCLVFIVFLAGLVVVAYFAFVYGNPKLLLYPEDSEGNLCGVGSKEDKKFLFFFDLSVCGRIGVGVFVDGCPTPQVCVKECPTVDYNTFLHQTVDQDTLQPFCKESADMTKTGIDLAMKKECPPYLLKSTSVLNRCLPIQHLLDFGNTFITIENKTMIDSSNHTVESEFMKFGLEFLNTTLKAKELGDKVVADVVASWKWILLGLVVAMVISLVWITLMRWLAGFMVWLTILAFVAIWLALTVASWYLYSEVKGQDETFTFYLIWRLTFQKEKIFLAGGIIFGVILIVVLLILLFLCHRIMIAVALIKEGSRAVGAMWSTLMWPVFPFILQLGVVALWGSIATYLTTVGRGSNWSRNNITYPNGSFNYGEIKHRTNDLFEKVARCDNNATAGIICEGFFKYLDGDYTIYLQIYNLFMLFWLYNFVSALGQLTLSGSFASWYWAFEKPRDVPTLPLLGALGRCFRYHLGSLALGSLLIAIVQIIRAVLEYLDHKLKGSENPVAKFFLKCLKCCFWCLEKFLRFLCKNAFIMMAVYGKNFCSSAVRAFELILKNCVRAFVLDKVTDFLMFVCKLVVVGAVGVISYFFFDGRIQFLNEYRPQLNFYLVPIVIVILGSYIVADVFFSVYEMAVDTVFLCFLDDIERNDGSRDKPYFMGKTLMKVLGKANRQLKGSKKDKNKK